MKKSRKIGSRVFEKRYQNRGTRKFIFWFKKHVHFLKETKIHFFSFFWFKKGVTLNPSWKKMLDNEYINYKTQKIAPNNLLTQEY